MAVVKAYRAYHSQNRKDSAQDHDQNLELSDKLSSRLDKVEGRLDSAERELRATHKKLSQSRIKEDELQAAIDALVHRIDRLIGRLEQHEKITQEEKERLTSVPYTEGSRDREEKDNSGKEDHASSDSNT